MPPPFLIGLTLGPRPVRGDVLGGIQQHVNQLHTVLLASTSHLEISNLGHLNDVAPPRDDAV